MTTPLQRYNIDTVFEPTWNNDGWEERLQIKESDNGDWVKCEDVKKLEDHNKEMMDVLRTVHSMIHDHDFGGAIFEIEEAIALVEGEKE